MALYHRIRSNHALNNKTRQMVYDAVVKTPGIGVNDAAKAANCSYSTAAYHLERLVEERLLVCSEDGRRARYFKNGGAFSQAEREFVPILQSQEAMNVLQVIVENPWCYRAEVAQKLGVSGPTVNWHLKKLMNVGAVKEMREGRVSYLYADKKVLTSLGANLIGKLPDDLVQRLRFENRPAPEFVEPAVHLPETGVPELGVGEELELAPLPEASTA
jgi:predicted transcriptional regulator